MPLYFAYGSNMDRDAMTARCPASRPIGIGRLMRHRFIISRKAMRRLRVIPTAPLGDFMGPRPSDMPALDRYESLSTGLYTKAIQPIVSAQGLRRAIVYVGRDGEAGVPKPGYMEGSSRRHKSRPALILYRRIEWLEPERFGPCSDGETRVRPL